MRPTRKHVHEEVLPGTPEEVFALLHTPSAIRHWWAAAHAVVLPERGGTWAAAWGESEDGPDYVTVATIGEFDPPRRLVLTDYRYWARTGPLPFEADFVTAFLVTPHEEGAVLRVTQDGFPGKPEADEFYAACETGWRDTFEGIRRFLGAPADSDGAGRAAARLEAVHPVLMSRGVADSVRFYERLGFTLVFQDDARSPRYAVVRREGVELHLQWQDASQWSQPGDRPVYRFVVDDVDRFHAELQARGALTEEAGGRGPWARPGDTPWGTREFHLRDPDGNGLQFYLSRPRRSE